MDDGRMMRLDACHTSRQTAASGPSVMSLVGDNKA